MAEYRGSSENDVLANRVLRDLEEEEENKRVKDQQNFKQRVLGKPYKLKVLYEADHHEEDDYDERAIRLRKLACYENFEPYQLCTSINHAKIME